MEKELTILPEYIEKSTFRFDIYSQEKKDVDYRIAFPEMEELSSWEKHKNRAKVFNSRVRFILFMYDKGSGFIKKFTDIKKRREVAIQESGINPEDFKEEEFLNMVTDFLIFQNDRLWHMICLHYNLYVEYSGLLMSPIAEDRSKDLITATKVKEDIRQNLMKVNADLDNFLEEFYRGDKEVKAQIEEKIRYSPENISKKLKK